MRTILLIEDNERNANLITHILRLHGYRLLHAADGESGLLMAIEEKPDLILLDVGLPDIEGMTLAALIKGVPEMDRVPLVAVTAWPPDTAKKMTRAYGCDGYICKPITPQEFPSQVAAYLDGRGNP
jgi:DNA-binding response OmpR family regulator